jgi:hypothetical protein
MEEPAAVEAVCELAGWMPNSRFGPANPGHGPISANLLVCFSLKLPKNRHPERSASQIYRMIQRLAARSRRTSAMLILPVLFGAFHPPSPHRAGPPRSFPGAENQELASVLLCPAPTSTFCTGDHQVRIAADPVVGLRWSKAPSSVGKISIAEVLRLRATKRCITR